MAVNVARTSREPKGFFAEAEGGTENVVMMKRGGGASRGESSFETPVLRYE